MVMHTTHDLWNCFRSIFLLSENYFMRIFFLRKFTRRNKSELPYPPVQKQKMANKSITLLKTWIPIYPHSQATPWSCQNKFRTALFPCIVWPVHQATVKNRETDGKATCIYKLSVLACVWVSLMIVAGVQTLILTWSNMIAHRLLLSFQSTEHA